jgi:hypothetical protein
MDRHGILALLRTVAATTPAEIWEVEEEVTDFLGRVGTSDILQAISLQKCIQIADIFSLFLLHKCLLPKCKKKNSRELLKYNRETFYRHIIPSEQKCLCRLQTDKCFIGRSICLNLLFHISKVFYVKKMLPLVLLLF